jgi:hypothetical protein
VNIVIKVVHGITIVVSVFVFTNVMAVQAFMIGVQTTLAQPKAAEAQALLKIIAVAGQVKTVRVEYGKVATAEPAAETNKNHKPGHSNGVTMRFVAILLAQSGVKQLVLNHVLPLVLLDMIGGI